MNSDESKRFNKKFEKPKTLFQEGHQSHLGSHIPFMNSEEYNVLRSTLEKIESAIIGNQDLGHDGLVKKVAGHEIRLTRVERYIIMMSGASLVIGVFYTIAKDFIH